MERRSPKPNPVYPMTEPDEPIVLLRGHLRHSTRLSHAHLPGISGELPQAQPPEEGPGDIVLVWRPVPHLRFSLELPVVKHWGWSAGDKVLEFEHLNTKVEIKTMHGTYVQHEGKTFLTAHCVGSCELGQGSRLVRVVFHLANFPYLPRDLILRCGKWTIAVDRIPDIDEPAMVAMGIWGHLITHSGAVERADGKEFEAKEAIRVLERLTFFLAFLRGAWCPPLLPVGFSKDGARCWELWADARPHNSQNVASWLPDNALLDDVYAGFVHLYEDRDWRGAIQLATRWYVEANSSHSPESTIMLIQATLEMLAWMVLVGGKDRVLSEKGFGDLAAADKVRLLLVTCGIPTAIPPEFGELTRPRRGKKVEDGPIAFTEVRNQIVHPNPQKHSTDGPSTEARHEARLLGLWYLDLILLRLFRHSGQYIDRVSSRPGMSAIQNLPWHSDSATPVTS